MQNDAWFEDAHLQRVRDAIGLVDAVLQPALTGPALLLQCARHLQRLRMMTDAERDRTPDIAVTHVVSGRFGGKYDLDPDSDAAMGTASGEPHPTTVPGTTFRVYVVGNNPYRWVTFDTPREAVPRAPERIARRLGIDWDPTLGNVIRVEVPLRPVQRAGAAMAIPTLFDRLDPNPRYPVSPDWRARPAAEHAADEPWGMTRDMVDDGPALPEIIVDVRPADMMDAFTFVPVSSDWSRRPYLTAGGPR